MGAPVWGHCDNCGEFASKCKQAYGADAPDGERWCPNCLFKKANPDQGSLY